MYGNDTNGDNCVADEADLILTLSLAELEYFTLTAIQYIILFILQQLCIFVILLGFRPAVHVNTMYMHHSVCP